MALIYCPECKKRVSDSAAACPHCGYQLTARVIAEVKKKAAKTKKVIGVGFILLIFLICLPVFTSNKTANKTGEPNQRESGSSIMNEKNEEEANHDEFDAFLMSQKFVKKNLKAPATAEFPKYKESFVYKYGVQNKNDTYYVVDAYVDSQNSFGAKIRTKYTCEIKTVDGKNWNLEHIKIE